MHDRSRPGQPGGGRHAESVGDQRGVLAGVNRSADHFPGEGVKHHAVIKLALAGRVLGDVGQPEAVRSVGGELSVNQVFGDACVGVWSRSSRFAFGVVSLRGSGEARLQVFRCSRRTSR